MGDAACGKRRLALPAPPQKRPAAHLEVQGTAGPSAGGQAAAPPQHLAAAESDDEGSVDAVLSDTEAALQLLKSQFQAKGGVLPFALKSQLYTILKDRTLVDRQLDELRHRNKVRVFQLPTGAEDIALMLASDYAAALGASRPALAPSKGDLVHVFDWFRDRVLPGCCELMLTHQELLGLLGSDPARPGGPARAVVSDAHVALLLSEGYLTRHPGGLEAYYFAMPRAGPAVRSLRDGRAEIVQALQRRRYPEIPERELEKRRLQRSVLSVRFHVRDMLGCGALLRLDTTVGPVLRLPPGRK